MAASRETRSTQEKHGVGVRFTGLNHNFIHGDRAVHVLDDFNLDIPPAQFVSLVGPSGCGKTTALHMVAGLLSPREGEVRLGDELIGRASHDVAVLFARDAVLPWRSVRANVELGLEVKGVPKAERRTRSDEWLQRVRLSEFAKSDVMQLSQGMRQRVAIARTLVQKPRVVLMDEPFAALDAQTRSVQQEEFVRLWEAERPTVIFVTHDLQEAILLSDRVVLMSSRPGRIVADLTIDLPRPRTHEMAITDPKFRDYYLKLDTLLREQVKEVAGNDGD